MEVTEQSKKNEAKKALSEAGTGVNYGACSSSASDSKETNEAEVRRGSHWSTRKIAKEGGPLEQAEPSTSQGTTQEVRPENSKKVKIKSSDTSPEERKEVKKEEAKGHTRTKSNQRWLKLRTTVQLSGAISSTIQKSKPALKREDSFLKRFSTRQIPDVQETLDTGDETDAETDGPQDQDEVNRRRLRRRRQSSRFVVNPDETFYYLWLMVVAICVLYNLWAIIVRQSFPELQKMMPVFWFSCDGFADLVFLLDVAVQFRTGYLEQGLMVYDTKKLAGHYVKSRAFLLDILSLIPLDILQYFIGIYPILRFTRFFKTYRVYDYYYMVESRTVYPNLWRVVNLVHILLILAHWFGCFYFLISEAEGFKGDWVYPYQPGEYATLTRMYLGSLYWSTLTLTTIGDLPTPETNVEFVFTIVSYLIGVFIFATIVGQVGNVITNRNANRLEFERLLDGAKTYMRHHKVPSGMKRRVLRWYDYSWSRGRIQGGGDINTALGLLPDKLKTELALHVNLSVLKKVTIFQECQPEFLHDLVLKMKAYIFTPGDLICRKGEVAREMFIIADGILDVISDTGRVLTTMKAGDFFGEIGILNLDGLNKRTADVRSVGYSELFSLSREDVLNAMKDYPEAEAILQTLGRKRLMEARNASKMFKSAKDQASSVESDTAGKRIVDKLRSDVKGLKNALRRSKRGTRSKDKQSMLTRMSHVQSSDEYDEPENSPIGPGLPLLQRLKLLKDKQEKEKQPNQGTSESQESDVTGTSLPLMQRLKLLKLKEEQEQRDRNEDSSDLEAAAVTVTVHTQQTGVKYDKSTKIESPTVSSGEYNSESKPEGTNKKRESGKLLKDALKKFQPKSSGEVEAKSYKSFAVRSGGSDEKHPKGLIKGEASKNKETKSLLRKSTGKTEDPKTSCLSQSGTILEMKSEDDVNKRRSRSASPSVGHSGRKSLKNAVENIIRDRRRTKSLGHAPKKSEYERRRKKCEDVNAWEFSDFVFTRDPELELDDVKKYSLVDDLSPEYSELPFVEKLKILNERQNKFCEDSARRASFDVPDRTGDDEVNLIRSHSDASALQQRRPSRAGQSAPQKWVLDQSAGLPSDCIRRSDTIIERPSDMQLDSPQLSPGSNETLERRQLKSILKRLSAEENEDGISKKVNDEEMKKLLLAPTVEGYAARHSKLTKSVTFNRETLQSPPKSPPLSPSPPPSSPFLPDSPVHIIKEPIAKIKKEKTQEDDIFVGVISGIKQVMQAYLDEMQRKFQKKIQNLEREVRLRDELIAELERKIQSGESPNLDHSNTLEQDCEDTSGGAFMRDESIETVRGNSPPTGREYDDYSDEDPFDLTSNELKEEISKRPELKYPYYRNAVKCGRLIRRHSDQENIELRNFLRSHGNRDAGLRRARSEEESRREYIAIDLDDSDFSDSEIHNRDWEVEMLAEELERRNSAYAQESLNQIESEVKTLQKVVETTDLDRLSPSEFRTLKSIIKNSDKKISSLSQSSGLDFCPGMDLGLNRSRMGAFGRQTFSVDFPCEYRIDHRRESSIDRFIRMTRRHSKISHLTPSSTSMSSSEEIASASDSYDSVFEDEASLMEATGSKDPSTSTYMMDPTCDVESLKGNETEFKPVINEEPIDDDDDD